MKTIRRLIHREALSAVGFVTAGFLALFFFFDLVDELRWVGRSGADGYQLSHALLFVVLSIPSHLYELLPITVLIGTIFVMARTLTAKEWSSCRSLSQAPVAPVVNRPRYRALMSWAVRSVRGAR